MIISGVPIDMQTPPDKALQATAAALPALPVAMSHNAVVAGASALPAAVPEPNRQAIS